MSDRMQTGYAAAFPDWACVLIGTAVIGGAAMAVGGLIRLMVFWLF